MDVRKFEAYSMNDAVKLVRQELGKDAVIIRTREVVKKLEGSQKPQQVVEIYASPSSHVVQKPKFPQVKKNDQVQVVKGRNNLSKTSPLTDSTIVDMGRQQQTLREVEDLSKELSNISRQIRELPELRIADQLDDMKVLLSELLASQNRAQIPQEFVDIYVKLKSAGLGEQVIANLLNDVRSRVNDGRITQEQKVERYLEESMRYLYRQIKVVPESTAQNQKIIAAVGQSGVGKSSVLLKMAARAKSRGQKVSLISWNRLDSIISDSTRVYAQLLEVSFFEVPDLIQMQKTIRQRSQDDFILIDTNSKHCLRQPNLQEMFEMTSLPFPIEVNLVIGAGAKQREIDELIRAYRKCLLRALVFTKLDESWGYGEIANSTIKHGVPVSYFSIGDKIPDDLEVASQERVLERLFNL